MSRTPTDPTILRLGNKEVPLAVHRHPRARHISLRVDGSRRGVRLVLPRCAPLREGLDFAAYKADWILGQIDALPARVPFEPGAIVPILGEDHVIRHGPGARRGVWCEHGVICASGRAEYLPRRVGDFLKVEARRELSFRVRNKAAVIGRPVRRVSVRDTKSRWGSCSNEGNLSFSWRLIFAPETVFDYVVAHEVAHLKVMNHGPRFWALTAKLTPDAAGARRWLRERGDELTRYG